MQSDCPRHFHRHQSVRPRGGVKTCNNIFWQFLCYYCVTLLICYYVTELGITLLPDYGSLSGGGKPNDEPLGRARVEGIFEGVDIQEQTQTVSLAILSAGCYTQQLLS